jgi:hypothetical protein
VSPSSRRRPWPQTEPAAVTELPGIAEEHDANYPCAMPIVGHHPESGLRLSLERDRDGGPPWRYEGAAFTPTARFSMRAVVDESGGVRIELDACDDRAIAEKARRIVRAAFKHAQPDVPVSSNGETQALGAPLEPKAPPRRIVRWRGESEK